MNIRKTFLYLFFLSLLCLFSGSMKAQGIDSAWSVVYRTVRAGELKSFVDSLTLDIYADTVKFKRSDLIHDVVGTQNKTPYSPLYVIDNKYFYKLDIIKGSLVAEFVRNILLPDKIDSIHLMSGTSCGFMFGRDGMHGGVLIFSKKSARMNYHVAGLTRNNDLLRYSNLRQRMKGEISL